MTTHNNTTVKFAEIKDELYRALGEAGGTKKAEYFAELFSITEGKVKAWRGKLMDEHEIFIPAFQDNPTCKRPRVSGKGAIAISAAAFAKAGITLPPGSILDISFKEQNDDPETPYKGSQIILTFNGDMGSSVSDSAEDDDKVNEQHTT